jgi:DhnA family fructose-bisphosphate aldolase class Ia
MGRNAFQHEHPERLVAAACAIVHDNATAAQAKKLLKGK